MAALDKASNLISRGRAEQKHILVPHLPFQPGKLDQAGLPGCSETLRLAHLITYLMEAAIVVFEVGQQGLQGRTAGAGTLGTVRA